MDLPAAFFFSVTIVQYLNRAITDKSEALKIGIMSGIFGGALIAIIYFLFSNLGAHYAQNLMDTPPEQYLAKITYIALGKNAALIFALTMFFACITTAAALCKLFAEFLQHDIARDKISWNLSIIITALISFTLSLTGFKTIASMLGIILTYIYPALIVFTISAILHKYTGFKHTKHVFWLSVIFVVLERNFYMLNLIYG
ncbi:MAG UNVERIFIED_CONTAM: branched-chain amino acid transport system II carrier protein [Rickettsiaceae bacterium]|jgi:LIVCS family branched-chain amino acid:cation transporter